MNDSVGFAGVPHNFGAENKSNDASPMGGDNVVATGESKVVPGAPPSNTDNTVTNPDGTTVAGGSSPLDKFKGLFDNSPKLNADGTPATVVEPVRTILDASHADFTKAAEGMDFTPDVTEDQMADLLAGGEKGVAATLALINSAGKKAFAQSSATSNTINAKASELSQADLQKQMTEKITLSAATEGVASKNANLMKPEFAPIVSAIQQRILSKFPDIQATELTDLTITYFGEMSGGESVNKTNEEQKDESGIMDFLGSL